MRKNAENQHIIRNLRGIILSVLIVFCAAAACILVCCGIKENYTLPDAEPAATWAPVYLDLNSAGADDLALLPNIGASRAEAIIEYRTEHGGFESTDEVLEVYGIGEKTYAQMQPYVTCGPIDIDTED